MTLQFAGRLNNIGRVQTHLTAVQTMEPTYLTAFCVMMIHMSS